MISAERYCLSCGAANGAQQEACFACGKSLKITAPLPSEGDRPLLLGRYRIVEQVGKGGFSAVYRAEDTRLNNHMVAIKAITLSGLRPQEVIEATEAFNREMLVLSGLKHPNLPRIYDHFAEPECWYLVMDFIEGVTLEKHLEQRRDGCLPLGEVLEIGVSLCAVLEYLHSRQPAVIFRDLKPANIMLTTSGGIALIDFGIARHFKPGQLKDTMPFGSPGYAAPEQYGKRQTTLRTDIYGLGALLHQLISGHDPSETPFRFAPLDLQQREPMLAEVEPLIMQMVEMDAAKRPESATVVKEQLQRLAQAWFRQYLDGLKARGLPAAAKGPVSWQSMTHPSKGKAGTMVMMGAGSPGQGQVSMLQAQYAGGAGTSGAAGQGLGHVSPKKSRNKMAIASLLCGFMSIFVLQFGCSGAAWMLGYLNQVDDKRLHLLYFLPFLLMLLPAVLAIVFGKIGEQRANTVAGWHTSQDIAATGETLGYMFGTIYAILLLVLLWLFLR